MKKVLLIAAFTFAAVSSRAQVQYAVSGTSAANGKTVYLIDELAKQKIDGIPDTILIDPLGKIIDRGLRGKALHTRLEKLLN